MFFEKNQFNRARTIVVKSLLGNSMPTYYMYWHNLHVVTQRIFFFFSTTFTEWHNNVVQYEKVITFIYEFRYLLSNLETTFVVEVCCLRCVWRAIGYTGYTIDPLRCLRSVNSIFVLKFYYFLIVCSNLIKTNSEVFSLNKSSKR